MHAQTQQKQRTDNDGDDSLNYRRRATKQYESHNQLINRRFVWLQRRGGKAHGGGAWALWTSQNLELRAMSDEIGAHEDSEANNDSTRPPGYH